MLVVDKDQIDQSAKELFNIDSIPKPPDLPKSGDPFKLTTEEAKTKKDFAQYAAYKEIVTTEVHYLNIMETHLKNLNDINPKTQTKRDEIKLLEELVSKGKELLAVLYKPNPEEWKTKLASLEEPFKKYNEFYNQNIGPQVLIEPVQRLPRYNLLFKEFIPLLEEQKQKEYRPLLEQTANITASVNAHVKATEKKDTTTEETIKILNSLMKKSKGEVRITLQQVIMEINKEPLNISERRTFKNLLQVAITNNLQSKKDKDALAKLIKKIPDQNQKKLIMRSKEIIVTWIKDAEVDAKDYLNWRAQQHAPSSTTPAITPPLTASAQPVKKEEQQKAEIRPKPFVMGGHRAEKPKPFLANVTKPDIAPDPEKPTLAGHRKKPS